MNYSFEYIDIILLAMIAGFIFLRLRGILVKELVLKEKHHPQFKEVLKNKSRTNQKNQMKNLMMRLKKNF